jgi:hypothetical protein
MKHSIFWAALLIMVMGTALAAFGDEITPNVESRMIDTFDGAEGDQYVWKKEASRYAVGKDPADKDSPSFSDLDFTKSWSTPPQYENDFYPKVDYKPGWPLALFKSNKEGRDLKIYGIWGKFKRMGYNWIDIYPTLKADGDDAGAYEIPLPGRVRGLDMWVWGSGLNYYLEAYVRDQQGVVHTINLGSLAYQGWKNLRASISPNIPQRRRWILDTKTLKNTALMDRNDVYLKFIKFRIWTTPREEVGNFYVYFDHFKILTDTFESLYDGDDLTDPDWIRENWYGDAPSGAAGTGN